jgi:hypothetical protein
VSVLFSFYQKSKKPKKTAVRSRGVAKWISLSLVAFLMSACAVPEMDVETELGREGIMDGAQIALTREDCSTAIDLIEPLYFSKYANNKVRLLRASAYGCAANINFFRLLGDIVESDLGGGFFTSMTQVFYHESSGVLDNRVEAAYRGIDALLASTRRAAIITPAASVDLGEFHKGSLHPSDRIDDSNAYLMFMSMAQIGLTQSRYGNPDPSNYRKQQPLPWSTSAAMTPEGCGYVGSILNLFDSLEAVGEIISEDLGSGLDNLLGSLKTGLTLACALGCSGIYPTGCTLSALDCSQCPTRIRHRSGCQPENQTIPADKNPAACAAAGIIHFINNDSEGWPDS